MTDLEDRLRHDLRELAELAHPGSIRALRAPQGRGRSRLVRWLAPVAAVAAVLGVVVAVSLAGAPPGPPGSRVSLAGMPPHYVTLDQPLAHHGGARFTAVVHDSVTGQALTSVGLPTLASAGGGAEMPTITAAGDNRTFVITETGEVAVGSATRKVKVPAGPHHTITIRVPARVSHVSRFYLLRVAAGGRSATLRRLPVSVAPLTVDDVALSRSAGLLAVAVQSCGAHGCQYSGIRVIDLATGAARTWTTRAPGAPWNLSWAGPGQVMFLWESGVKSPPRAQRNGYRVLNVTGPGGRLLPARPVVSPAPMADGSIPRALLTPDGTAVITSTAQNIRGRDGRTTVVARIVELSASTGRLIRVLHVARERTIPGLRSAGSLGDACSVVALGPSGGHALVQCFGFGRLDGGRFTPLPGVPNPTSTTLRGPDFWGAGAW
ncbi:MAG TPA: hypothetical protein VH480_28225 [Streptosporangiaceae bacterium]